MGDGGVGSGGDGDGDGMRPRVGYAQGGRSSSSSSSKLNPALRQPTPVAHGAPTPMSAWAAQRTPMWEQPGTRGGSSGGGSGGRRRDGRGGENDSFAEDVNGQLGHHSRRTQGGGVEKGAGTWWATPRVETTGARARPSRGGRERREKQRTPPKHFTFDHY